MASELTTDAPTTVDLAGLPESVVRQVRHLVEEARQKQARTPPPSGDEAGERLPLLGRFAHLGISLTKDDLDQARREAWAGFPRDLAESTGG